MEKAPKKRVAKKVVGKSATAKSVASKKKVSAKKMVAKKVASTTRTPRKSSKKLEKHPLSAEKEALVTRIATKDDSVALPVRLKKAPKTESKTTPTTGRSDDGTVKLITGVPSLRLQSKVAAYKKWYEEQSPQQMRRVAVVFGYVFMMFGAFSVFAFSSPSTVLQLKHLAGAPCADLNQSYCDPASFSGTDTASSTNTAILYPEVIFPIAGIAVEVGKDTEVELVMRNVASKYVFIISLRSGARTELPLIGTSGGDRYKYKIPSSMFDPGEYRMMVKVTSTSGTNSEYQGPTFVVPTSVVQTTQTTSPGTNTSPSSSTSTQTNTSSSSVTSVVTDTTSETKADTFYESPKETKLESSYQESTNDDLVTYDPILVQGPDIQPESEPLVRPTATSTPIEPKPLPSEDMRVRLSPGIYPGQYKVEIVPTYKHTTVELYVRRINATQNQFIGVASRTSQGWLYWLDARSLPTGKYTIIVRGLDGKEIKETKELPFENLTTVTSFTDESSYTTNKETIKTETTELAKSTSSPVAQLVDPEKPLIPTLLSSPYIATGTPVTRESEVEKVREILTNNSDTFNEILRRYGSALQTGDDKTLRLTESAINEQIYTVLGREVVDSDFEDSIYTLEADIREQLNVVKEQIRRVETFKKERTQAASSVDTDEDGISDYDEYLLYNTDPNNPDTDNDGVTDGIEISLGYDPVDEKPEAIIEFNSPKEVSYEDDTLLGVQKVEPLLVYEEDEAEPVVQSEIHGFGLPNSFVTLYIFSDPIVVTVKTKDDGSFSYTFSKELEDGDHEVYAALTDNKGQIVVRSTAFKFVKTAEAYTYVNASEETATVLTDGGLTSSERTYNIVAAMGVVSFGLILLMLGATLRQEKPKPVLSGV